MPPPCRHSDGHARVAGCRRAGGIGRRRAGYRGHRIATGRAGIAAGAVGDPGVSDEQLVNRGIREPTHLVSAVPGAWQGEQVGSVIKTLSLRGVGAAGGVGFDAMAAAGHDMVLPPSPCDANAPINNQFTSGTTGAPKGATSSHRNPLHSAVSAAAGRCSRITRGGTNSMR